MHRGVGGSGLGFGWSLIFRVGGKGGNAKERVPRF